MNQSEHTAGAIFRIQALLETERRKYEKAAQPFGEDWTPSVQDTLNDMILEWNLPSVIQEFLDEVMALNPASSQAVLDYAYSRTHTMEEQDAASPEPQEGDPSVQALSRRLYVWYVAREKIIRAIESTD